MGRAATPSAAIRDSQAGKTTEQGGPPGDEGGKKSTGRTRPLRVDTRGLLLNTRGLLLNVVVPPATRQDRAGARRVLAGLQQRCPRLRHRWADQASTGPLVDGITEPLGWTVELVARSPRRGVVVTADGEFQRVALPAVFEPVPRRWVVERPLAWTSHSRRRRK